MKHILKQRLTLSDILLIAANLIPLWGVWFRGWDAKMMFVVYCLESVIVGLYNLLQMWLVTLVKKKDVCKKNGTSNMLSGYFFMLFFLFHYGVFIFVQLKIFLSVLSLKGLTDNVFMFLFHLPLYLPNYALWVLLYFTVTYGLVILKDFVYTGVYKTIEMSTLFFAPYGRIFVQQFVVIIGSFVLMFNKEGKIFILVFIICKIFFELMINYKKLVEDAMKKKSIEQE